MWFQDLFNYDFRRTEMCIIPYATQQGEISFCAYNTGIGWRNFCDCAIATSLSVFSCHATMKHRTHATETRLRIEVFIDVLRSSIVMGCESGPSGKSEPNQSRLPT